MRSKREESGFPLKTLGGGMVKMKKRFAAILVAVGLVLALSGCATYTGARSQMV